MIHIENGDLLQSDCTILAHQANCLKTMGGGIAKQIKKQMPEIYEADKKYPYAPKQRYGKCSVGVSKEKNKIVFNLYGQFRPGVAFNDEEKKRKIHRTGKCFTNDV